MTDPTPLRVLEAIAPIIAVGFAAYLATLGYRTQRTIDRQLAWYTDVHRDVQRLKRALAISSAYAPGDQVPAWLGDIDQEFADAEVAFMASAGAAQLFGERKAREAVIELLVECERFSALRAPRDRDWDAFALACQRSSDAVAAELRDLMAIQQR